jgi:hypothetical protein
MIAIFRWQSMRLDQQHEMAGDGPNWIFGIGMANDDPVPDEVNGEAGMEANGEAGIEVGESANDNGVIRSEEAALLGITTAE